MADLFGLSPEEINRVANSRVDTGRMMLDALGTAGAYNYNQAQAHRLMNPDLVDLNFNGTKFTVRREDVPQAISAGARWLEATEKVPMKLGDQTFMIRGGDIAEAVRAGATLTKLPSEIAANTARAAASNAAASASQSTQNLNEQKLQDARSKQAAFEALKGVDPTTMLNPENFSNVARAQPSALTAATTRQLTPPPAPRRDPNAITPQLQRMLEVDNHKYNVEAANAEAPDVMVLQDGKNTVVRLPMLQGKQLTAKDVAADAATLGISISEWYARYKKGVEGK